MLARNATAHEWKATYRSLVLRETVFWRAHDLLAQAHHLYQAKHVLGSRILIRSALETVAILIRLNQITAAVLQGTLQFSEFEDDTTKLLLGSRDGSTKHVSLNVATVLMHCERKYEGISDVYATLSECAHPNYEGVCFGYSDVDPERHETVFSNKWEAMWGEKHESTMKIIFIIFENEYNNVWAPQFDALEAWLSKNDPTLA